MNSIFRKKLTNVKFSVTNRRIRIRSGSNAHSYAFRFPLSYAENYSVPGASFSMLRSGGMRDIPPKETEQIKETKEKLGKRTKFAFICGRDQQ